VFHDLLEISEEEIAQLKAEGAFDEPVRPSPVQQQNAAGGAAAT
jgi:hypothetical protein